MHPFLFEILGFKVYSWGAALVVAFIIGFVLVLKTLPKFLSQQDILNICLITIFSLLVGTKMMQWMVQGDFDFSSLGKVFNPWERGSHSFYAAFILAIALIFVYCKIKKIPLLESLDFLLPYAILGLAVHRCFGCFLAGCCYGKPTNLPWGMVFPGISRAGQHYPGIHLHPTQLYYGLSSLLIFIFLLIYKKHTKHPDRSGEITALGLVLLSITYFFITFLRGDIPTDQLVFHLSLSQYMALALFIIASFMLVFLRCRVMNKESKKEES
jgi:phosphatidylglycerol:prolipoprotein diacylglycerol transferase